MTMKTFEYGEVVNTGNQLMDSLVKRVLAAPEHQDLLRDVFGDFKDSRPDERWDCELIDRFLEQVSDDVKAVIASARTCFNKITRARKALYHRNLNYFTVKNNKFLFTTYSLRKFLTEAKLDQFKSALEFNSHRFREVDWNVICLDKALQLVARDNDSTLLDTLLAMEVIRNVDWDVTVLGRALEIIENGDSLLLSKLLDIDSIRGINWSSNHFQRALEIIPPGDTDLMEKVLSFWNNQLAGRHEDEIDRIRDTSD